MIGIFNFMIVIKNDKHQSDIRWSTTKVENEQLLPIPGNTLKKVFGIIIFTTAIGGFIFQSTTFALPKIIEERLSDIVDTATMVGWYTVLIFDKKTRNKFMSENDL